MPTLSLPHFRLSPQIILGLGAFLIVVAFISSWLSPKQLTACIDEDSKQGPESIYTQATVRVQDSKGKTLIHQDICNEGGTEVSEFSCRQEADNGAIINQENIPCPLGCLHGACLRQESDATTKKAVFSQPYPIAWQENSVNFSLASAVLGRMFVPPGLIKTDEEEEYQPQDILSILTLTLTITTPDQASPFSVPLPLRRIAPYRSLLLPNNEKFIFPDTGDMIAMPGRTYTQHLFFVVPTDEQEFAFTTLTSPPLTFTVTANDTPNLVVKKTSLVPPAPSIEWLSPVSSLSVARGGNIPLAWRVSATTTLKHIYFSLSTPGVLTQTEIFLATDVKGLFPVQVPPGNYILKVTSPDYLTKEVSVRVTGPVPTISSEDSYLTFDDFRESRGTIIANGFCAIKVTAHIRDKYGYGIKGATVILTSTRLGIDRITKTSDTTFENGEIHFTVTSNFPGTSRLSARANSTDLSNSLTLEVLDPKSGTCPEENRQD